MTRLADRNNQGAVARLARCDRCLPTIRAHLEIRPTVKVSLYSVLDIILTTKKQSLDSFLLIIIFIK
jgi:hypothetical protein